MVTATKRFLTGVGILFLTSGGCSKPPAAPTQAAGTGKAARSLTSPPEVTSEEEEGFHDLVFQVQKVTKLGDGSRSLQVAGLHKGRPLGFEVVLGPSWDGGSIDKNIPLVSYRGNVTYRSIGPESDAFVQVLDELYGTKAGARTMKTETQFTGMTLEGEPRDLTSGPVQIKLFFEAGGQDSYAELYTNVDIAAHRLEFREKNVDYRSPIIKALRGD